MRSISIFHPFSSFVRITYYFGHKCVNDYESFSVYLSKFCDLLDYFMTNKFTG